MSKLREDEATLRYDAEDKKSAGDAMPRKTLRKAKRKSRRKETRR